MQSASQGVALGQPRGGTVPLQRAPGAGRQGSPAGRGRGEATASLSTRPATAKPAQPGRWDSRHVGPHGDLLGHSLRPEPQERERRSAGPHSGLSASLPLRLVSPLLPRPRSVRLNSSSKTHRATNHGKCNAIRLPRFKGRACRNRRG